ncbi:MAG: hypothetical protein QM500_14160 [Methylococcales bacterium]
MAVNLTNKNHSKSLRNKSSNLNQHLLHPFSIEVLPKQNFACVRMQQFLPAKTRVFIPHLPKTTLQEIIDTVKSLKLAGFEPIPHIAARRISNEVELEILLSSLYELKVKELLLIAGSRNEPIGEYQHCIDLLNSEVFNRFRFKRLLFAGHPEGHTNIAQGEIETALLKKVQLANKRGYETAIVTQFCFNNKVILQWFQRISKVGIEQPIYIGITGPAKLKTLLRYSAICGVSTSAAQFIKQPKQMWNLLFKANPDYLVNTLIKHSEIQNKLTGFHVFSFGGVDETIQWVEKFSTSKKTSTKTISKIIRKFINLLDLSLNKQTQLKSIRVGLVVGLLLNIINYGDDFLGEMKIEYLKIGLTFLTPYCVSIYSLVSSKK